MKIIIQPNAKKDLKKLPKDKVTEILKKLFNIRNSPLSHIERLKGLRLWKLRVGDYRCIIFINTKEEEINVLKVGHRKKIYRNF